MADSDINIEDIPSGYTDQQGIDAAGRIGNIHFQMRETVGRRPSQEDQFFAIPCQKVTNAREAGILLRKAFANANKLTINKKEGSCATIAIVTPDHKLTIAHMGDSPAVLFIVDKSGDKTTVKAHSLIKLHKPDDPDEKKRIEAAGGSVECGRVNGILAVSRAFGDCKIGPGVGKTPDITPIDLQKYIKPGQEAYLCVSCDGLYEGNIFETRFAEIIRQALIKGKESDIANYMKNYAMDQGSRDNISVILAKLPFPDEPKQSIALGVCDGHGGKDTAIKVASALQETIQRVNWVRR